MKHTPGPWLLYKSEEGKVIVIPEDKTRSMIVNYNFCVPEEALANARLISAAPDLLEALISGDKKLKKLAISKATGDLT